MVTENLTGATGSARVPEAPPAPAGPQNNQATAADSSATATAIADDPDVTAERRLLIELLIYAWDRARSAGVWERLTAGLEQVGVQVIRPDGEPFDPTVHEVGGVQTTSDPLLHNTVAETESAGFSDRGTLIREPVVVVYRQA